MMMVWEELEMVPNRIVGLLQDFDTYDNVQLFFCFLVDHVVFCYLSMPLYLFQL